MTVPGLHAERTINGNEHSSQLRNVEPFREHRLQQCDEKRDENQHSQREQCPADGAGNQTSFESQQPNAQPDGRKHPEHDINWIRVSRKPLPRRLTDDAVHFQ